MRLTAKIMKGTSHTANKSLKAAGGVDNDDLYEYLSSNADDSLSFQTGPRRVGNQEE